MADKAAGDPVPALDTYYEQGYSLVTSKQAQQAFDIQSEPDKVRDAYGRTAFGQRALLARRLVEAGVPFVTLYDGGWDSHSDIFPGLSQKLPPFEHAIAALDRRPRPARTAGDDAGRGPGRVRPHAEDLDPGRGQKLPGRDHWANAMSVMFAGCGVPGGPGRRRDRSQRLRRQSNACSRPRISPRPSTASWASIPTRSITRRKAGRPTWSAIRRRSRN